MGGLTKVQSMCGGGGQAIVVGMLRRSGSMAAAFGTIFAVGQSISEPELKTLSVCQAHWCDSSLENTLTATTGLELLRNCRGRLAPLPDELPSIVNHFISHRDLLANNTIWP